MKEGFSTGGYHQLGGGDEEKIKEMMCALLDVLSNLPITVEAVRETKIGKAVNDMQKS